MKLKPNKLGYKILWSLVGLLALFIMVFWALIVDLQHRSNQIKQNITTTQHWVEQTQDLAMLEKLTETGVIAFHYSEDPDLAKDIIDSEHIKDDLIKKIESWDKGPIMQSQFAHYITLRNEVLSIETKILQNTPAGIQISPEQFDAWNLKRLEMDEALRIFVGSVTENLTTSIHVVNAIVFKRFIIFSILSGFLWVFIILLYLYLNRTVTRPLLELSRYARSVSENKFNEYLHIDSKDEFGQFADSLKIMANKLQSTYLSLQEQVEAKTMELSQQIITLQQEQKRAETILESMADGLIVIDQDGKVLIMNEEAENITGFNSEELKGVIWVEKIPLIDEKGNVVPVEKRPISRALLFKRKFTASQVYYITKKNGIRVPISMSATPFVNNGEVVGIIEVFRDLSGEIAVDKAKSEFVSLASHQLRTPISAINWYAEALLNNELGELNFEQRKYLENIYASNHRMISLVNTLLNISRLELGTFNVKLQEVKVEEIPSSVIEELRSDIKLKKIVIHEMYDKSLPLITTDPDLLRVIFQNLLSNAVKYTPKGGKVHVEISYQPKTGQDEKAEGGLFIKISDTGFGIPKSQQEKVFTKLFRGDNIRQYDTDGTGLGLYIVKSVVDFYEGEIWFESAENIGTQFYITLPFANLHKKA